MLFTRSNQYLLLYALFEEFGYSGVEVEFLSCCGVCDAQFVGVEAYTTCGVCFCVVFFVACYGCTFPLEVGAYLVFLACYKDFTPGDAIRESVRKTKGNVVDIFFFKLGFLPWFLLCPLVFPIFYVVPYYKQSVTCFFLRR